LSGSGIESRYKSTRSPSVAIADFMTKNISKSLEDLINKVNDLKERDVELTPQRQEIEELISKIKELKEDQRKDKKAVLNELATILKSVNKLSGTIDTLEKNSKQSVEPKI